MTNEELLDGLNEAERRMDQKHDERIRELQRYSAINWIVLALSAALVLVAAALNFFGRGSP